MARHRQILGENIRSVRTAEGMTFQQLGDAVGVSAAYIRDLERGRKGVAIDLLARIAYVLKTTVNELTAGT